ncbi:homing endonuclease associated repeat-containing protein [Halospeciosus flavus]|uniref:Homing endonuclease associated repeat-containing protein n=1 Tax=Halospeciosus flavus TaxID=3032283 RepID=A0ABD5Z611_9EURY|nr:hypothetical protein [Halospeciosus flavus]
MAGYEKGSPKWTAADCIEALQQYADDVDSELLASDAYSTWASENGTPSTKVICKHFESWPDAVEAAGFEAAGVRRPGTPRIDPSEWDTDDIINVLQDAALEMGEPLTTTKYEQYRRQKDDVIPSSIYIHQSVDGWNTLLRQANIETSSRDKTLDSTYSQFLSALIEIYEESGSWPTSAEYPDLYPQWAPSRTTAYGMDQFTGWPDAIKDAKIKYKATSTTPD